MAKAQGKKTAAAGKSAAKKVAARVKSAVKAVAKKTAPKKGAAPPKPVAKTAPPKPVKPAPKAAAKPAPKAVAQPAKKAAAKVTKAAAKVTKAAAKAVKNVVKAAAKPIAQSAAKAAGKPATKPAAKPAARPAAKPAAAAAPAANKGKAAPAVAAKTSPAAKTASIANPIAVPPVTPSAPVAPNAPEPEKKRGRRARTRITSSGAPAAAWLSTEKPRPASFIPAPPRAEAPSAIAAPPASSDRLLRPEDVTNLIAVRTVPVRIDIEQGAGRFYVIASPLEVSLKVGEGIEWDFRYIGGADVTADEMVIEFEKPSPFPQSVYRTRKPGGARPHRQLSGGALPAAAGKRVQYTARAMNMFKTEMASTKMWVNITG